MFQLPALESLYKGCIVFQSGVSLWYSIFGILYSVSLLRSLYSFNTADWATVRFFNLRKMCSSYPQKFSFEWVWFGVSVQENCDEIKTENRRVILYIQQTAIVLQPLSRSTCVCRYLQLRTGGFFWCKVLLAARMPLLMATSAFGLWRRCWSFPQQCCLHCLHTLDISTVYAFTF